MEAAGLDDPLEQAEIEVIAVEEPIEMVGFVSEATVAVPAGRGMKLPADTQPEPEPTIFIPPPVGTPARAVLKAEGSVEPIAESEVSALAANAPIVYSVTEVRRVDLRRFRPAAAQAARHDRRLVIVARGRQSG